jgi:hypothetical protein
MSKLTVTTITGGKHYISQDYDWVRKFCDLLSEKKPDEFICFDNTERETVNLQRQHIVSVVVK